MNKPVLPILHPDILQYIKEVDYGLIPFYSPSINRYVLVIKTNKEYILSVDVNNEFKCYFIKDADSKTNYIGLVTAVFDDSEEPLTIRSPLFSDDPMLTDITELFSQEKFDLFFFDENNYEMLRAKAINNDYQRFGNEITQAVFPKFQQDKILKVWENIIKQFGSRTKEDDINSFKIKVYDKIYLDKSALIREGDPGPMQEEEIAGLFRRIFKEHEIYLNPIRADKNKKEKRELVDILIVTNHVMIFVQAKDSPNTPDSLKRSIDRKRQTIRNHINKATNQLRGTLNYVRNHNDVTILLNKKSVTIKRGNRQLIGLIIVQELFDDDCFECSAPVLNLVRELKIQINLLDYPQLHILTKNLSTPAKFFWGLHDAFETALEKDHFPRSVFSGDEGALVDIEKQKPDDFFQHDDGYENMSLDEKKQLWTCIEKISKTRRRYKEAELESQMPFKDFYELMKIRHKKLENSEEIDGDYAEFYIRFLDAFNNLNTSEMQNRISNESTKKGKTMACITSENVTPEKIMLLINEINERAVEILKERGVDAEIKMTDEGSKGIYQNGPPAYALAAIARVVLQMVVNENLPMFLADRILEEQGNSAVKGEIALIQQATDKK